MSAIFDRNIGYVGAILAHECGRRLGSRRCFAVLVFDPRPSLPSHCLCDAASEIIRPLRSPVRFHRLFHIRHLLPLIREPMVDFLVRPFAGLDVSKHRRLGRHILSNKLREPLLFSSFGPSIGPEGSLQNAQVTLRHADRTRISGWQYGLFGDGWGLTPRI